MRWKPCSTGDKETHSQKENKHIAPSLNIPLMCFWIVLADMVSAHKLNHTNTFISVKVEHILCPQGFLIIIDISVIRSPYQSMKPHNPYQAGQIEHTKLVDKNRSVVAILILGPLTSEVHCTPPSWSPAFTGRLLKTQWKTLHFQVSTDPRLHLSMMHSWASRCTTWLLRYIRHVQTEFMYIYNPKMSKHNMSNAILSIDDLYKSLYVTVYIIYKNLQVTTCFGKGADCWPVSSIPSDLSLMPRFSKARQ